MQHPTFDELDRLSSKTPTPGVPLPRELLYDALAQIRPEADSDEVFEALKIYYGFKRHLPKEEILTHAAILFNVAHHHPDVSVQAFALDVISELMIESSYIESFCEEDHLGPMYEDRYFSEHMDRFKANHGDDWKRRGAIRPAIGSRVCDKMEGFCVDSYNNEDAALILNGDGDESPSTVWLFKNHHHGRRRDFWDVLVNLASGEVYSPGSKLNSHLLNQMKENDLGNHVFQLSDIRKSIGDDEMNIHFRRLVHTSHPRFARLRNKLLKKHLG